MAVMEHHSAGLRSKNDESPIKLRDNAPNTLSQISSVLSEKDVSPSKKQSHIPSSSITASKDANLRSGLI